MKHNLVWEPYFEIAGDPDRSYEEKLAAYASLAAAHYDTDRFNEFCDRFLTDLDEVALEYFGTDRAHEAVRRKVAVLFPADEVDQFTAHFWGLVQFWRHTEADRLGRT